MARVGLDIDDVIYPWYDRAHSACVEAGITGGVTPTSWSPFEEYGCSREVWVEVLTLAGKSIYDAQPVPGALEAINRLIRTGHEVVFVTARGSFGSEGDAIRVWTHEWMDNWGLGHLPIIFTTDKGTAGCHYFLDDRPEHVEATRDAGAVAYLRTRSWNLDRRDLPWVADVGEFVDLVLGDRKRAPSWDNPLQPGPEASIKWMSTPTFPGPVVDRSEVRVTSPTGGQKGKKLARLGSIDPVALKAVAEVSGFGAEKYAAFNFLRGYDWSLSYDALQRHLGEAWSGVELDDESGLPHLAHAAWHCLALLSFSIRGLGTDDRPARALEQFARELEATQHAVAATLEDAERNTR